MNNPENKGTFRRGSLYRSRSLCWLTICALLLEGAAASANPTSYPARVINHHRVDLMPLIAWWENPRGERPLTGWKHVHGFVERETIHGWVVRGTIEGETGLRFFLLKNPPKKEMSHYKEITALLPRLEREKESNQEVAQLPAYKGWGWDVYGEPIRMPTEDFDRIEHAQSKVRDLDQHIHALRAEQAAMSDTRGHLKVDAFALELKQVQEGSHVFDFGFPSY